MPQAARGKLQQLHNDSPSEMYDDDEFQANRKRFVAS